MNLSSLSTFLLMLHISMIASALTLTSPGNNSKVNSFTQTVAGACNGSNPVRISGDLPSASVNCTAGAFSASLVFSGADGLKTLVATQLDGAADVSKTVALTIDATPPVLTLTSPASSYIGASVNFHGACETGLSVIINFGGNNAHVTCVDGAFDSGPLSIASPDGLKAGTLVEYDAVGNRTSISFQATRDSVAPNVALGSIAANIKGASVQPITFNAADSVAGLQALELRLVSNDGSYAVIDSLLSKTSPYNWQVPALDSSNLKVRLYAADKAGNEVSVDSGPLAIISTPPVLTIKTPGANRKYNAANLTGTCTAGLNLNISGDLAPVSIACDGTGNYAASLTMNANDGQKNIQIQETDAVGNSANQSVNFILDTAGPALAINSHVSGQYVGDGFVISGSCEAGGGTGIINLTGSAQKNFTCTSDGKFVSDSLSAGTSDGAKTLTVIQYDAVGNKSSLSLTLNRDTTAPVASISNAPVQIKGGNPINVAWTASDGGSGVARIYLDLVANGVSTQIADLSQAVAPFVYNVPFSDIRGAQLRLRVTDKVGLLTTASSNSFDILSSPPRITLSSSIDGLQTQGVVNLAGQCVNGLPISISGDTVSSQATCAQGAYSLQIQLLGADGPKTISLAQTDGVGNASVISGSPVLDTVAPLVTMTSQTENQFFAGNLIVSGTCETASGNVVVSGADIASAVTVPCNSGSFNSGVLQLASAADGTKSVRVSQTDAAGNVGSMSRNVILDMTAPTTSIASLPAQIKGDNDLSIAWSGSDSGSGVVSIYLQLMNPDGTLTLIKDLSKLTSPYVWHTPAFDQTGYKLQLMVKDQVGNLGRAYTGVFEIITTAPSMAFTSPAMNAAVKNPVAIAGSCKANINVVLSGDAGNISTNCDSGSFSISLNLNGADGIKTINASQTDAVGHSSQQSLILALDTTGPQLAVSNPATGQVVKNNFVITGTCENGGSSVGFSGSALSASSSVPCSGGAFTSGALSLVGSDGAMTLVLQQADNLGNIGSMNLSLVKDTAAPILTVATTNPVNSSSGSASWSGSCETGLAIQVSGAINKSISCTSGQWSLSDSASVDGTRNLLLGQTDAAGNTASLALQWTEKAASAPVCQLAKYTAPSAPTLPWVSPTANVAYSTPILASNIAVTPASQFASLTQSVIAPRNDDGQHPSTFWDQQDINAIKSSLTTNPTLAANFATLKALADKRIAFTSTTTTYNTPVPESLYAVAGAISYPSPHVATAGDFTLHGVPVPQIVNGVSQYIGDPTNISSVNAQTMQLLGVMYVLTGNEAYGEYVRQMLLDYATYYNQYAHPAGWTVKSYRSALDGRLSYQFLNDAFVFAEFGWAYDLVYNLPSFTAADRVNIRTNFFEPVAAQFSDPVLGSVDYISSPNNRGAIVGAAVLIAGYASDDQTLINNALYGTGGSPGNLQRGGGIIGAQWGSNIMPDGFWIESSLTYQTSIAAAGVFDAAIVMEHHGMDAFGQYPLKRMLDSAIQISYPNPQMQLPDLGNSTAGALMSSTTYSNNEVGVPYELGYLYYGDSSYLPLIRNSTQTLLMGIHSSPPSLFLNTPQGPGVLVASSFASATGSLNPSQIFSWLMTNQYFQESTGTQGDAIALTAAKITALNTKFGTQAPGVLSVLQQALAARPAPPINNVNYPYDGYGVLRLPSAQGASVGTNQLLVEYGSNMKSHGQPNGMAIDFYAMNNLVIPLPGDIFPYSLAIDPNWFWTTVASNTLVVDQVSQLYLLNNAVPKTPTPYVDQTVYGYTSTMGIQKVSSNSLYPGVAEDRAVFMTSNYLADVFAGFGSASHTYDLPWHWIGTMTTTLPLTARSTTDLTTVGYNSLTNVMHASTDAAWKAAVTLPTGSVATFWAAANPGSEIITGNGHNYVYGSSAEIQPPLLIERQSGVNNAIFGNVLDISATNYVTGITQESITAGAGLATLLRIQHGTSADYAFSAFAAGTYTSADLSFSTDALQAFVVYSSTGTLQSVFLGGGKNLSTPEVKITRTDAVTNGASGLVSLEYTADGVWHLGNPSTTDATIHIVIGCAGIDKTIVVKASTVTAL